MEKVETKFSVGGRYKSWSLKRVVAVRACNELSFQ